KRLLGSPSVGTTLRHSARGSRDRAPDRTGLALRLPLANGARPRSSAVGPGVRSPGDHLAESLDVVRAIEQRGALSRGLGHPVEEMLIGDQGTRVGEHFIDGIPEKSTRTMFDELGLPTPVNYDGDA